MILIAETRHRKYGSAVFAKPNLNIVEVHTEVTESQIELITVSLAKITIPSVYKPPASEFEWPSLPEIFRRPFHLLIGSARWQRGYNPDVAFVSTRIASMCQRGAPDPIPRTQHRPITIIIRSPVTASHCPFRRRFDLNKDNWSKFTNEIDQAIANILAHPNHYNDFVDLVKKSARHNIPRGCQKEYIPGLSDESSDLLKLYDEEYNKDPFSESTIQLGDTLLDEISDERRNIWRDMVGNTNITMNSKKAWATIPRLWADSVSPPMVTTVTADQIANQLLSNGRRVEHRRPPSEHYKTIVPSNNQPPTELTKPFSLDELATGVSLLKPGKAAGLNDVLT